MAQELLLEAVQKKEVTHHDEKWGNLGDRPLRTMSIAHLPSGLNSQNLLGCWAVGRLACWAVWLVSPSPLKKAPKCHVLQALRVLLGIARSFHRRGGSLFCHESARGLARKNCIIIARNRGSLCALAGNSIQEPRLPIPAPIKRHFVDAGR